jgi:hypothetical protein
VNSKALILSFALLFAVLASGPARAADVSLTAEADKTEITMDEAVTLRVTLSGGDMDGARPAAPEMPGFRAAFAGQSQNISFVNGRVSSEIAFTYVLQPLSPGVRTIPSFTVQVGGQTLSTQPIVVKVLAGKGAPPQAYGPPPSAPAIPGSAPAGGRRSEDLFLTASVDKPTATVGQALTLAVRFYSRVSLLSQPAYSPPALSGFLSEDLPPQRQFVEPVSNRRYNVIELRTALFPAAPGKATVGPASLECRTEDFSGDTMNDPFGGSFFRDFFSGGKPVVLRSDPVTVRVLPLPDEGRPSGFKGDVGRYRIAAALDRAQAALREPVTLTVTVEGEGNIKALSRPELPAVPGLKAYDTLSSLNISKAGWTVRGSKVFKTIVRPEVSGRLTLPPVVFSFFDPDARAYRTVRTEPLTLSVSPGPAGPAGPAAVGTGVQVVSKDVRYLPMGPLSRRPTPFHETNAFPLVNGLPGAAFLFLLGSRALNRRSPRPGAAASRARAAARKTLKRSQPLLARGQTAEYLAVLEKTLRDYGAAKLGVSPAALTWEDLETALTLRQASPGLIHGLWELWEGLHRARYTPGAAGPEVARAQAEAFERLLTELGDVWG